MSNQEIFSQRGSGLVSTYRQLSFGEYRTDDISSTLKSRDYKSATDLVAMSLSGNTINRTLGNGGRGNGYQTELSYTLTATDVHSVNYGYAIRRLTPMECERLQGFPDNHTKIPWNEKSAKLSRWSSLSGDRQLNGCTCYGMDWETYSDAKVNL
nr:DNA cytosine methyltransferase [Xenorhabdus sp. Vera]